MVSETVALQEQALKEASKSHWKTRKRRWQARPDTNTKASLWEIRPDKYIVSFEACFAFYSHVDINEMFKLKA